MNEAADLPKPLLSTDWLAANLGSPDLVVIDASWRMPPARRREDEDSPVGARGDLALSAFADGGTGDAYADYLKRHIPGAAFFPIDEIADRTTALPHMLAPAEAFEKAVGAMGVGNRSRVVVYDDQGLFSAARVWWTFRTMGHLEVAVLDGGLPKWIAEGRPVTAEIPRPAMQKFHAAFDPGRLADHRRVQTALAGDALVLDARPEARFRGAEAEPRPGLRRGHMPGAVSVPASSVMTPDGRLKPPAELRRIFEAAGLDGRPVIATCGSGITAAILALALETLGRRPAALYDGSWAEWGSIGNDPEEFPVEAGEG